MKTKVSILAFFLLIGITFQLNAQQQYIDCNGRMYTVTVENGDTIYWVDLHTLYVFPPMKFKNKKQEKFYWKTVRDVKKTLPYARLVSKTLNEANAELEKMPNKDDQKKYLKALEKDVKKQYEPEIRKLTFSQGKMLIRLIDRETNMTSYELIKMYRGSLTAFFWQSIAKLFGANLKEEYDGNDKDKIIERVIILVEAGQL